MVENNSVVPKNTGLFKIYVHDNNSNKNVISNMLLLKELFSICSKVIYFFLKKLYSCIKKKLQLEDTLCIISF